MEDTHNQVDRSIGGHKLGRTMTIQQDDGASPSSPSLPDDLVAEILAYLPAKSVGRLLCLSRSWQAMLSSTPFFNLHLRRANQKPQIFFCSTGEPDDDCQFYAWQPGCAAVTKLVPNEFWCPALITRPLHGFVLVRCVLRGYYVFNPSTGEVQPLPDSRAPLKMGFPWSPQPCYSGVVYGFGYFSVSHEYKAVRIFSKEMDEEDPAAVCCEVFILNDGDTAAYWRPAASQPPLCVVEEKNPAVFLHGRLHFLCRGNGGILTFNVGDETFGSLSCAAPWKASLRTTELDGCLCVFDGDGDSPCNVWLLRDYAARRWEKLCCIDSTVWPEPERTLLQSHWISPLGICSGDNASQRKIMLGTGTCKVFTVDIGGGGVPEILLNPDEEDIAGEYDDSYDYPAIGLFEESLVTFGNTGEDKIFSSPVTEAWSDVLKWLPAWSVMELSLVCREWQAMVATDRFIRSHADVHATSSPRVMLVSDPFVGSFIDLEDHIKNPHRYGIYHNPDFRCSQPCHGLNLGSWNRRDILYNPTTGYHESVHVQDFERDDTSFAGRIAQGYDDGMDDHVMVSFTYVKKDMETRDYEMECHMRSLRGGWDEIEPPPRPVAIDVMPAYSNGKIYWLVEPKLGPCSAVCELVAFDTTSDKEFEVLQGPPRSDLGTGRVSILELYDTICIVCPDEDKNAIDVWMMNDDDDGASWCLEYCIELDKFSPEYTSLKTKLLCTDPTDGRILLNTGRSLGYYHPKTAELQTIYTVGEQEVDFGFPVIVQDSLVRPFMKQTY